MYKSDRKPGVVVCAGNPSTWEVQAKGQPDLHYIFHSDMDYKVKFCFQQQIPKEYTTSKIELATIKKAKLYSF